MNEIQISDIDIRNVCLHLKDNFKQFVKYVQEDIKNQIVICKDESVVELRIKYKLLNELTQLIENNTNKETK